MGIISRAEKKDERLKYKNLYESELHNRKMYEQRYRIIEKQYQELQKESGIAELRKENMKLQEELAFVKEDRAKLYVQLEDARNELDMLKGNKENGK